MRRDEDLKNNRNVSYFSFAILDHVYRFFKIVTFKKWGKKRKKKNNNNKNVLVTSTLSRIWINLEVRRVKVSPIEDAKTE